ncbi:MAG: P-II family nitrogen regulator [Treponema sp.]|jgi:nitrogen regulatory protein PII|nr:P-II family nitrogen regulator [Treponema sp.]
MAKESLFSKLFSRLPGLQQDPAAVKCQSELPVLKMIFFVVDWNQAHVVSDVLDEEKVRFHFVTRGKGTANSDILDLLGIGASEKAVVICIEQAVMTPILLKEVRKKLGFYSPGAGIAFTVPLSGINSPILWVFKQSIHKNDKISGEFKNKDPTDKGETMADQFTHDLIISIINQGYSDEFMNTAREAGASGGTVLNARGQAHEGTVKFFGISVQDEKEIIIILTSREKKEPIMRTVCETHGLNSKAQGIVFSLPVDKVMGLGFE